MIFGNALLRNGSSIFLEFNKINREIAKNGINNEPSAPYIITSSTGLPKK